MRSVSVRLADLNKVTIPIGFVGENLHTQVRIDCVKLFEDYPNAVPGLTVNPPMGDTYPAVVTRDGDYVIWEVEDSDLTVNGNGEIQLSFFVDEVIAKSYIARIRIEKSLVSTGDVPTPIENWIDDANEKLAEVEKWDNVTAEATTLAPGTSATVEITEDSGHNKFVFGIPEGDKGDSGFSPVITVTDITGGHRVSITDVGGTQTVDIMDGEKGDTGNGIASAVLNQDYTLTLNFTDGTHYTTPSIRGAKGETGDTGNGIASVTLNQDYTLTITYTNGQSTTTASIRGEKGETGATPVISIGTVSTLQPGSDATASMDVTDPEHPVLSFGIPEGDPGEVTEAELNAVAESKADIIHDTASGSIATFPDGANNLPVKTLVAQINPVQSGTGDPSPDNVRPITGWSGANLCRTGENLLSGVSLGSIDQTTGQETTGSNGITDYIRVKNGETYTLSPFATSALALRVFKYGANKAYIGTFVINSSTGSFQIAVPSDTYYIRLQASSSVLTTTGQFMLAEGSSASAYEAYTGETYSITFPSTVYGGTLTVNEDGSGELIADRATITLNGSENNWYKSSSGYNGFYTYPANPKKSGTVHLCNMACFVSGQYTNTPWRTSNGDDSLSISTDANVIGGTTVEAFKEWLAQNNIQFVYELATPIVYDLTELEVIETLKGLNNVWADTGDVSVEYPCDTKLYIEKKLSASRNLMELIITANHEDSMKATKAYTVGNLLIVNGTLYKATTSIANGATLTVGTNVSATTVATELALLA